MDYVAMICCHARALMMSVCSCSCHHRSIWAAKNPENVMSFGPIHDEFLADTRARAGQDTLQGLVTQLCRQLMLTLK
jgi:hypothetical protein